MPQRQPTRRRGPLPDSQLPARLIADAADPIEWIEAAAAEGAAPSVPTFKGVAYTGGLAKPRGFWLPVVFDLAGLEIAAGSRPMHRNHDTDRLVGHSTTVEIVGRRIVCAGHCSAENEHRDEVVGSAKNGFPWRLSVGLEPLPGELKYVDAGEKIQANGQTFTGPLYVARKSILHEISFVSLAGDERTSVSIKAAQTEGTVTMPPFAEWIQAQGFDVATLSETQRTAMQATYDLLVQAQGGAGDEDEDEQEGVQAGASDTVEQLRRQLREEAATESRRQSDVRRICADHGGPSITVQGQSHTIEALALQEGWDAQRTELECLRESRARGPAAHSHGRSQDCTIEAMQAAMLVRSNIALDSPHWLTAQAVALDVPAFLRRPLNDDARQRYMEAGHRYSDLSMLDVCREAIRLEGRAVPSGRAAIIEAAFSTNALSNIYTANVSARLLSTYMEYPDTTLGWTSEDANVPDYKLNERTRLLKGASLAKLPAGGTAEDESRDDTKEEYRLARYARKFIVDEIDVINDRFNALNDVPVEMGNAAGRLRPDLVYSILLANAALADGIPLFHSSHANTAGSAALAEATLKAAITALSIQQENGVNLNLPVTHLIVPQTLAFTGDGLIRSAETREASATGGVTLNTLQGKIRTRVSDSRLDNGVTDPDSGTVHSGSTSTWYLASASGHTIEVGYLRGAGKAPRIRRFTLDKGQYGIGWDVSHSIGAKALDYRALLKRTT